jgi:predicted RND superfamily exporter protein
MIDTNILSKLQSKKYNLIIYNSKYEIASKKLNSQVVKIDKLVKKYDKNGMVAGEGALMQNLVTIADHDFKSVNYTSIGVIFVIMLFVLKSISLPFILIVAIEIAIFTNWLFFNCVKIQGK